MQFLSEQLSARKKELKERGQLGAFLPFDKPTQNLAECYISDDKVGGEGARVKWFKAWDDLRQMSGSIMAYILDSDPLVRPFAEAVSDYNFLVQAVSEEELDTIKTQELNPWVLPWERVVGSGMCEYMRVLHDGVLGLHQSLLIRVPLHDNRHRPICLPSLLGSVYRQPA